MKNLRSVKAEKADTHSVTIGAGELCAKMIRRLTRCGYNELDADTAVEEFLLEERISGNGKGVEYFLLFIDAIKVGFNGNCYVRNHGCCTVIDAGGGLAHIPFFQALPGYVAAVKRCGVGVLAIKNDITFIRAGYPAHCIAQHDLVALSLIFVNRSVCSPEGIKRPVFGTNPIAFCCPTEGEPFIYDSSTASMSGANFKKLKKTTKKVSKAIGIDQHGEATKLLSAVTALLPIDGNRGLGLMMTVEILAGSLLGYDVGQRKRERDDFGVVVIAIDPSHFTGLGPFKKRNSDLLIELKALSAGSVHIPGYNYPKKAELRGCYAIRGEILEHLG